MVHYFRDVWPRQKHVLAPLKEASSRHKGGKIFCNEALEGSFKELKRMVSDKTNLSYIDWTMTLKKFGSIISTNNKPISFFSIKPRNPQRN